MIRGMNQPKKENATEEKAVNTSTDDAGEKGSREAPQGDQEGQKWPGGGKKGEDE